MTRYTADHEWISDKLDGVVTVGITDHAQSQLGDVVFIELPAVGKTFKKGEAMAVVESTKAASDVYAPLSGEIVEINQSIIDDPSMANTVCETQGWFVKIRLSDEAEESELLDEESYKDLIA